MSTSSLDSASSRPSALELLLGTILRGDRKNMDLRMDLAAIIRHVLAVGSTGSGKSVVLKVLAECLMARRIPMVVCDVMGDLTGLAVPAKNEKSYQEVGAPVPSNLTDEVFYSVDVVYERLRPLIHARLVTPCSDLGERLAVSPLPLRPRGFHELYKADRDDLELQASSAAGAIMERVGLKIPKLGVGGGAEMSRQVFTEAILKAWHQDMDLDGAEGFDDFLRLVTEVENMRLEEGVIGKLKIGLDSLRSGQAARWLEGIPLDWDNLFATPEGKTPLVIVALNHIPREFHPWVVAQVANSLFCWAASKGSAAGRPRAGLLIDELRGEGGRNSLLPPLTYSSPSGHALRRILRQGRHYGLGLLAGTQSPKDIDSTNLPQFNTLFVGKLTGDYDIRLMLGRAPMSQDEYREMSTVIKTLQNGNMFMIRANGTFDQYQTRWLGTIHTEIPSENIPLLYKKGIFHRSPAGYRTVSMWRVRSGTLCDPASRRIVALDHLGESGWLAVQVGPDSQRGESKRIAPQSVQELAWWLHRIGDGSGVALVVRDSKVALSLSRACGVADLGGIPVYLAISEAADAITALAADLESGIPPALIDWASSAERVAS